MTSSMLTAQQVQDLLDVDASTVYRMAGDGRLPAIRIGRQWRFPAEEIEALLVPRGNSAGSRQVGPPTSPRPASHVVPAAIPLPHEPGEDAPLPTGLATAVLEAVAPALGVTMVVTDLSGRPLTPLVNPAPGIVTGSQDPSFATECSREWRGFAHEPHLAVRLQPGRFGFLCAHSLVRNGPTLVAMVLAGGIAPEGIADPDLFALDDERRGVVLETLPRTAALLSRLATLTAHPPAD